MRDQAGDCWYDEAAGHLVRPYAITGGRTRPSRDEFTLVTQVVTVSPDIDTGGLGPEPAAVLDLCRRRPLSVAEIAAHLDLPVSVVKILLGDLVDGALIAARASAPTERDPSMLQTVIDALHRL